MRHLWMTWLLACTPADPERQAAEVYAQALEPLLEENGFLADNLLGTAGAIHDGRAPEDLEARWTGEIVPLTENLYDQSRMLSVPDAWNAEHQLLIAIWKKRAESYRELSEATLAGDADRWTTARKVANEAKREEEAWFNNTNARLGKSGVSIDQYP